MPAPTFTNQQEFDTAKQGRIAALNTAITDKLNPYIAQFEARGWTSDPRYTAAVAKRDAYTTAISNLRNQAWSNPQSYYKSGQWTGLKTAVQPKIDAYSKLNTDYAGRWGGWNTPHGGSSREEMASNWEEALDYINRKMQTPWGMNDTRLPQYKTALESKLAAYRQRTGSQIGANLVGATGGGAAVTGGLGAASQQVTGGTAPGSNPGTAQLPVWMTYDEGGYGGGGA